VSFDFTGTTDQTSHFINSKPYIVASLIGVSIWSTMARDLPINEGLFLPFDVHCPEGSILNCRAPAPISAAHIYAARVAEQVAMECLRLALAASPQREPSHRLTGWYGSALGTSLFVHDAHQRVIRVHNGTTQGSSAGEGRDGYDLLPSLTTTAMPPGMSDVEVWEDGDPCLFESRNHRPGGKEGAGEFRAGAACEVRCRPHGVRRWIGQTMGTRAWLPLQGAAGGTPGARVEYAVVSTDGSESRLANQQLGIEISDHDVFVTRAATGGGFGDPLDRDLDRVAEDVRDKRITPEVAATVYGALFRADGPVSEEASLELRDQIRRDRLARARRPPVALVDRDLDGLCDGPVGPLYVGVVQRGRVALSQSGTPLSVSPGHWTEGCAVLEEPLERFDGPEILVRSYLDPVTGRSLYVEAVPLGAPTTFMSSPNRWTGVAPSPDQSGMLRMKGDKHQ
jgi:N-methylhydantoinase B